MKEYIEEQGRLEEESLKRKIELNSKIYEYISGLTKEELKNILLELIYDSGEIVFNLFLREHIFEESYYEDYYEED